MPTFFACQDGPEDAKSTKEDPSRTVRERDIEWHMQRISYRLVSQPNGPIHDCHGSVRFLVVSRESGSVPTVRFLLPVRFTRFGSCILRTGSRAGREPVHVRFAHVHPFATIPTPPCQNHSFSIELELISGVANPKGGNQAFSIRIRAQ